ncbi:BTAD domain-containing putative transcriptional regulator [Umezawaea sp. Da 62-37]|uniref:AfsR/SARP family transcriptional regulator n=1 Tax=Umezawaea sp. Da 62-37 TaxID=3075927 RepID=UPI0028F74E6D|nr:BTAD domain-containing putative transcriptional regulator [Umezawaea sp. Da 62-37]WNV88415.1 BTAD domain-containing putative transcriptional regulator [Umezawaea sp. Da 62-37]
MAEVDPGRALPVRFTVLGPVRAWRGDVEIDLGAPQQRLVFTFLLAAGGRPVVLGELVDLMWDENAPSSAVNVVHRSVGLLRRMLEPGLPPRASGRWLLRKAGGYQLEVDEVSLDLLAFRALAAEAGRLAALGAHAAAVPKYAEAFALWHGRCADGLDAGTRAAVLFAGIDQERLALAKEAAESARHAGMAEDLLPALRAVADQARLDEALQAEVMLLLAAAGHQAEALGVYQAVRAHLSGELGIGPGPELRAAQQRVLAQQASSVPPPVGTPGAAVRLRPAQLPADLPAFTGRRAVLADLEALLPADRVSSGSTVICAIDGMPGTGKTTLAVHLAHRMADRYPDGQLYVNLRGFDLSGAAMDPAEALRGLLGALDVLPTRMPSTVDEQVGLYRSLTAGKRMLVVLDNARDANQVRPLLPGSASCLVIVASRDRLTGLAATDGAHLVSLNVLSPEEARENLVRRIGAERIAAEPHAVDDVVRFCAGLPLALSLVAARAAAHPDFPLSAIADELKDTEGSLDAFGDGSSGDVRTVFSWSYRTLGDQAARLFRLLSLHLGPDISLAAAASLLGTGAREVRALLIELIRGRLVTEHSPRRFAAHDLIGVYAAELSRELDSDADRAAALDRLFDHYRHTAHRANLMLKPRLRFDPPPGPGPGATPEAIEDDKHASRWFAAEHQVLMAAVRYAAENGRPVDARELALTMQQHLQFQGLWHEWDATMSVVAASAEGEGDEKGLAFALRSLAGARHYLGRPDDAVALLDRAWELLGDLGLHYEQAHVLSGLGSIHGRQHRYAESAAHHASAFTLYSAAEDQQGQANSLQGIAWARSQLGAHPEAVALARKAMSLFRDLDDSNGEANCWVVLADSHRLRGQFEKAVAYRQRAIELFRRANIPVYEAEELMELGDTFLEAGDRAGARTAWLRALAILEQLRLPAVRLVSDRLLRIELDEYGSGERADYRHSG